MMKIMDFQENYKFFGDIYGENKDEFLVVFHYFLYPVKSILLLTYIYFIL